MHFLDISDRTIFSELVMTLIHLPAYRKAKRIFNAESLICMSQNWKEDGIYNFQWQIFVRYLLTYYHLMVNFF